MKLKGKLRELSWRFNNMSKQKKPKLFKCKVVGCKEKFIQRNSFHRACSIPHAIELDKTKKVAKLKRERDSDKKRLLALQPLGYWIKKAQTACNRYIRLRDKNEPCISCGRYHTGQNHAGHFQSTGSMPRARFHPANIRLQCSVCNNHRSGNITLYRINLVEKVGTEMVEYLENLKGPHGLSMDDIKEIEVYYKAKCKELQEE